MRAALASLLEVIEQIEDFEPKTDTQAYVKRELLQALDNAREMLKAIESEL